MKSEYEIELQEFCAQASVKEGHFLVADLPRAADAILDQQQRLEFRVSGRLNGRHEPEITCIILGLVSLKCQRCLGPMDFNVDTRSRLAFAKSEAAMPSLDEESDEIDYAVFQPHFDLKALIEDELLLALPFAPSHKTAKCAPAASAEEASKPTSPFAALAGLKPAKRD